MNKRRIELRMPAILVVCACWATMAAAADGDFLARLPHAEGTQK